ncbi:hypothetical protein DPMN_184820 [Dreissena polymorpha]|uniref:Sushi domain-containing protein n=1 Tax=Dreissena polymorpha TaxID=45954 RepID=A0A9D4DKR0_DREPO|nr:hypothetical protein DPMN_184820 [Dreissena polymorpha]
MFDYVLDYECHSGYYPRPKDDPKCGVDGKWSSRPECYKHCKEPPPYDPNYARTILNGKAPYTESSSYTFECYKYPGLSFKSKGGGYINNCQTDGKWTDRIGCCFLCCRYSGDYDCS